VAHLFADRSFLH
jgi:hypothetical protein